MEKTTPSRQVLDATFFKAICLLKAIGTNDVIHCKLTKAGLAEADITEGWGLVQSAGGFNSRKPSNGTDEKAREAIAALDSWDEQGFSRSKAALKRLHPQQCEFLFENLEPAQGPEAIVTVAEYLKRVAMLEAGRSEETRAEDQKAVATLAGRGFDAAERTRLGGLVKTAQASGAVPFNSEEEAAKRQASLVALHAWYSDWAETARAVITRRDHLISLGLARRRSRTGEAADPAVQPEESEETEHA